MMIAGLSPQLLDTLKNHLRARRPESCTVYGSSANAQAILKNLGRDGVNGSIKKPHHTKYYVIAMHNDKETLSFYQQHQQLLQDGEVVLVLQESTACITTHSRVGTVSIPEVTATLFWRAYPAKPNEKIAFIGSGLLSQTLLTQGLCLNLYATLQCIGYHVWGRSVCAQKGVEQLGMDKIVLHKQPWQEDVKTLLTMKRIVLCGKDDENRIALEQLRTHPGCPTIYICRGNSLGIPATGTKPQVVSFGDYNEVLGKEILLKEELLQDAKALCGQRWKQLDTFERGEAVSCAAYFPVIRRLYKAGVSPEALTELEHIRWCRFHYLHGWRNGASYDDGHQIHDGLVPYPHLTEDEKQKERSKVQLALADILMEDI